VHKAYDAEECLNNLNELEGKIDDKIAAGRGAMLIVKIRRIIPGIKIYIVVDDETDKNRLLDYGADVELKLLCIK
jgi:hypothetical protein